MRNKLKLMAFIVGMIFCLNIASAMDFDNWVSYSNNDMKVTITNAFNFGEELGTAELRSHSSVDEIKEVPFGKEEVVMYYDFENWKLYKDGLSDVKFTDMKSGEEIEKDYYFVVWDEVEVDIIDRKEICEKNFVNGTKGTCDMVINGTHKEMRFDWVKYDSKDIPGKNVRIGIKTYVSEGDYMDAIWTIAGKKINKHAEWVGGVNVNMVAYWELEEGVDELVVMDSLNFIHNGTNSSDLVKHATGKVNYAYDFDNADSVDVLDVSPTDLNMSGDGAFSFWINLDSSSTDKSILSKKKPDPNNYEILIDSGGELAFYTGGSVNEYAFIPNTGEWYYIVINVNASGNWLYVNGAFNETMAHTFGSVTEYQFSIGGNVNLDPIDGKLDEIGIWNRTLSDEEIAFIWNSGNGREFDNTPVVFPPSVTLNYPINYTNSSSSNSIFNCTASDDLKLENVSYILNGVINETNSSGLNNSIYNFEKILSDGSYYWTCRGADNESQFTTAGARLIVVDTTLPIIENLSVNVSGLVFGYPATIGVSNNESDTHLSSCWYNLDSNETNVSFTCNSVIELNEVEGGNRTIYIYSNDTFGWENMSSLEFEIDYYTHNVSYGDGIMNYTLSPTCEFLEVNHTGSNHSLDVHDTDERSVECWLSGYGNFNYELSDSNKTLQWVNVSVPILNLTFDDQTNVSIVWLGGGLSYENVSGVYVPMRNLSIGDIQVFFNEGTQLYSFINDNETSLNVSLHLESVDFDQPVKVLDANNEVEGALVVFKKLSEGSVLETYSAYTDVNGVAHVIINDGTTYEIHVTAEGYEDYSELRYIPTSNTDTIIINLIPLEAEVQSDKFSSSCLGVIGEEKYCNFSVQTYELKDLNFTYTWMGDNYSVLSEDDSEATLSLWSNETTTTIYVWIYVDDSLVKIYSVSWDGLETRTIQLDFDDDEIKDESLGIIGLFYLIVLIIGVLIAVSVNRMPKMKGYGVYGMTFWLGIIAVKFPLLWFIVIPVGVYVIFKLFFGREE